LYLDTRRNELSSSWRGHRPPPFPGQTGRYLLSLRCDCGRPIALCLETARLSLAWKRAADKRESNGNLQRRGDATAGGPSFKPPRGTRRKRGVVALCRQ